MQSVTQSFGVTYRARPESVAQARSAVTEFARGVDATPAQLDAISLAVSEAVTNAVLHAYRGAEGPIQVTAGLAGDELWILVVDEGVGMEPKPDRPGLGLGLGLIAQVCDDMTIASRSAGGMEVRVLFRVPSRTQQRSRREATVAAAPAEMAVGVRRSTSAVPSAPVE